MKTIPQRTLRNKSGRILRQAEEGETFVITVQGRPVALLTPYDRRQWVSADRVREIFSSPADPTLGEELRRLEDRSFRDPWEE